MHTRRAFTLVELLIVIAIIALLAAITLPSLSRAREYAYFTTCKSRLRQFSVACLIHAGEHKGRMPEAANDCIRVTDGTRYRGRRIGSAYWGDVMDGGGSDDSGGGNYWIKHVYDDRVPGQTFDGSPPGAGVTMIGYPSLKGKYMPIEIMWDPIVGLRNWGPFGWSDYYTATEKQRDYLSRRQGTTIFGYSFFLHSIGCRKYQNNPDYTTHLLAPAGAGTRYNAEAFYRPLTNHRNMHTSNPPEAWVACCRIPYSKRNRSHFGANTPGTGLLGMFRFNVVHMDGHVGDTVWVDSASYSVWSIYISGQGARGYGRKWISGNPDKGVEDNPNIDESFDENT